MILYIDSEINMEFIKRLISEIEVNDLLIKTIVINSGGGDSFAADLLIYKLGETFKNEKINLVIVGDCSSAAFDIAYYISHSLTSEVFISPSSTFCVHTVGATIEDGRSPDLDEVIKLERKKDLGYMLEILEPVLSKKQFTRMKKGHDVYLNIDQALKVLNGKLIRISKK